MRCRLVAALLGCLAVAGGSLVTPRRRVARRRRRGAHYPEASGLCRPKSGRGADLRRVLVA